jgi:hypothetical protein
MPVEREIPGGNPRYSTEVDLKAGGGSDKVQVRIAAGAYGSATIA